MSKHTDGVGTSTAYTYKTIGDKHFKVCKHTGSWIIGETNNLVYNRVEFRYYNGYKPHWFHRLMIRLLLGWKWEDKV